MGYIAKSDGKVTRDEIELAEQVMQRMHLTSEQRVLAINLFNEGKKKAFRSTRCWRSLNARLSDAGILFKCFWKFSFRRLWPMAVCTAMKRERFTTLAQLNWRPEEFFLLLRMVSGQAQFGEIRAESKKLDAAYELLGVQESVADQELKKSYRRLMNQHHPDKLVAKGLPEEMIDIATQKTQDIKAAYELIKKHRS